MTALVLVCIEKAGDCIKRILVINDDVTLQHRIEDDLQSESTEVVFALSCAEALQVFLLQEFTMVLLDTSFSEVDSHHLLISMQKIKPIPILVISTKSGYRHAEIKETTVPYGGKPFTLLESVDFAQSAVKAFLDHDPFEEYGYILARGKDLVIDPVQREVTLKGNKLKLTRKEFDLLYCLAVNPGRVLTREQLYSRVWMEDNVYDVDAIVKTHISALRKKLATADMEHIRNIWGVGYRFDSEEGEK